MFESVIGVEPFPLLRPAKTFAQGESLLERRFSAKGLRGRQTSGCRFVDAGSKNLHDAIGLIKNQDVTCRYPLSKVKSQERVSIKLSHPARSENDLAGKQEQGPALHPLKAEP